jgi:hypothetical protein
MIRSSPDTIRAAIDNYLDLLDGKPKTGQRELKELTLALDRLVAEYQRSEDAEVVDDDADAPSTDSIYQQAAASYPTLGYYTHIAPDEDMNARPGLADAIDDLADIARDLSEVLWHLDQGRVTDAIWHFRFTYQIHWGVHLHSLRVYLHSTTIAAW